MLKVRVTKHFINLGKQLLALTIRQSSQRGSLLSDLPTKVDAPLGMSFTSWPNVLDKEVGFLGEAV